MWPSNSEFPLHLHQNHQKEWLWHDNLVGDWQLNLALLGDRGYLNSK
jgi:hypothetical protein